MLFFSLHWTHFLCPDVSQLISGLVSLPTREFLIKKFSRFPYGKILQRFYGWTLWGCSGIAVIHQDCFDPFVWTLTPQFSCLKPQLFFPPWAAPIQPLHWWFYHLTHIYCTLKKHPGASSRCSWAWEKFPVKTHRAAQALRPPRKCRFADNNYISCIYFFKLMFFTEVSAGFCCLKQGVSDFSRNFTTHCLKSNRRDGKRWAECLGWNRYFQRFSCVYINFFFKRKMFI